MAEISAISENSSLPVNVAGRQEVFEAKICPVPKLFDVARSIKESSDHKEVAAVLEGLLSCRASPAEVLVEAERLHGIYTRAVQRALSELEE